MDSISGSLKLRIGLGFSAGLIVAVVALSLIAKPPTKDIEWEFLRGRKPMVDRFTEVGWLAHNSGRRVTGPARIHYERTFRLDTSFDELVLVVRAEAVRRGGREVKGVRQSIFRGDNWEVVINEIDRTDLKLKPTFVQVESHHDEDAFGKLRRWLRSLRQ